LAGASVGCLSQHAWELFLTAFTPLPRTIHEQFSFEQTHIQFHEMFCVSQFVICGHTNSLTYGKANKHIYESFSCKCAGNCRY
jgi:hypothetical protein